MSESRHATARLKVIIVGAGIGGLSSGYCLAKAGHDVIILERAKELREIGAGIFLTPNCTRLLFQWGLGQRLEEVAGTDRTEYQTSLRYTGDTIHRYYVGMLERATGYPVMTLHRSDLQKMLIEISAPLVDLRVGCEVVSVNPNAASVTLQSGEVISADLVIGADGVHSVVGTVLGNRQKLLPTGDCTYRYLIPAEDMLQDADLRPLIETPAIQCWMGPGQHVVGYGIKGRSLYNMVVYVYEPDFQPEFGVSTAKGCTDQMREAYEGKGWDVRVLKLLRLAKGQHVVQHKMFHREPLDRWVHPDGPVALLGDACHLFPPHYGQAASLAIEDAAVLGNLFSRLRHRSQIRPLLGAYESIAKPRAAATWLDSMERQTMLHLPDGPEQQARDAQIPHARGLNHRMAHEATIPMVSPHPFGYDADKAVDLWLMRNGLS